MTTSTNTQQTTRQIGEQLVALCKQGKFVEAMESFYDTNIVSIEAGVPPGSTQSREVKGIAATKKKGEEFHKTTEVHSMKIEGPFMHGDDQFAVYFSFDVTNKQMNKRMQMTEVAVYWTKNGKIVREQFYYTM